MQEMAKGKDEGKMVQGKGYEVGSGGKMLRARRGGFTAFRMTLRDKRHPLSAVSYFISSMVLVSDFSPMATLRK